MTTQSFIIVAAAWLAFAAFLLSAAWLSSRTSVAPGAEPFAFREVEDVPPQHKARYWKEFCVRGEYDA